MKLINVEASFAKTDLEQAVRIFAMQAHEVMQMDGCLKYEIFRKPTAAGVAIIQHWASGEAFEAYRASAPFAELGASLKPMMTTPPVTTIAEVDIE